MRVEEHGTLEYQERWERVRGHLLQSRAVHREFWVPIDF